MLPQSNSFTPEEHLWLAALALEEGCQLTLGMLP
jgi:hypothetical protein